MEKLDSSILSVEETLDVTNALSDPTRYAIYRNLIDAGGEYVTVAEIAREFSLHPNVARMHLQKLVDVGLVETSTRKSPSGGRPARIYRRGDRVANLQFPPRDYRLLANLALQVVKTLAAEQPEVLDRVGFDMGREEGRKALARKGDLAPDDQQGMLDLLEETCTELGLSPLLSRDEETGEVSIQIRNCVFRELSSHYPDLVCNLHEGMLRGLLATFLEEFDLVARPAICTGATSCRFEVTVGG